MNKRVVVFGSFITDLTSRSNEVPIPGQSVKGNSFRIGPGGKGSNQAVAAHRAGAELTLVTKIGKDTFGKIAKDFYIKEGINTQYVFVDPEVETGAALIMVNEETAQNSIVVVPGASENITSEDIEKCKESIESAKILLLQLEINFDALYKIINIAHDAGVTIVLNTAPAAVIPEEILAKVDIITPNEVEAQILTGVKIENYNDAKKAAQIFMDKGVKQVVITLGSMGAFASDGVRDELVESLNVQSVDTTGAGDAFNGGFVTALAQGMNLFQALRYGNVTGALSVTKQGSSPSMPYEKDIKALYDLSYINNTREE